MGYDMTRDWKANHNQGRRPTGVMSSGWDGNVKINYEGDRNIRFVSDMEFGDDAVTRTDPRPGQGGEDFPTNYDHNWPAESATDGNR